MQTSSTPKLPNLEFFQGQGYSTSGHKINDILQQDGRTEKGFRFLEYDHSYIQWLIPNYFASQFNYDSYALTIEEAAQIKADGKAYTNYRKGLFVYLRFIGIEQMGDDDNQLKVENERSLYQALEKNTHNQLRIRRVLASMLAFDEIHLSKQLCKILLNYKPKSNNRHLNLKSMYQPYQFGDQQFKASMVLNRDMLNQFEDMDNYYQAFRSKCEAYKTQLKVNHMQKKQVSREQDIIHLEEEGIENIVQKENEKMMEESGNKNDDTKDQIQEDQTLIDRSITSEQGDEKDNDDKSIESKEQILSSQGENQQLENQQIQPKKLQQNEENETLQEIISSRSDQFQKDHKNSSIDQQEQQKDQNQGSESKEITSPSQSECDLIQQDQCVEQQTIIKVDQDQMEEEKNE